MIVISLDYFVNALINFLILITPRHKYNEKGNNKIAT